MFELETAEVHSGETIKTNNSEEVYVWSGPLLIVGLFYGLINWYEPVRDFTNTHIRLFRIMGEFSDLILFFAIPAATAALFFVVYTLVVSINKTIRVGVDAILLLVFIKYVILFF